MDEADPPYQTRPFPAARQTVVEAGRLGVGRPLIHGLLEIDVTRPRAFLRAHKARTGETLSFTAFVVACLARALGRHPALNAYRNWRNQIVSFDDVDVVTLVETEADGVALPHILRSAQRRSYRALHDELRRVQAQPARSQQQGGLVRLAPYAPAWSRSLFYWGLRQNPHWLKRYAGTTLVTALGMFGAGAGWGFGFLPLHTLGLTVGGIAQRPAVEAGQLVQREVLCLTISVDHDLVDGAPAARFAQHLRELLEQTEVLSAE